MMANPPADILSELENAVATSPPERCARIFAGIVRLLTARRDRPHDLLVDVVDGVLLRLSDRVASSALAQLSRLLAELTVPPRETLRRLALHEDPDIACPVLIGSPALSAIDLATIAASSGEQQQHAICARARIEPSVVEALIARGHPAICLALIKNPGAVLSQAGYAALIALAEQNDEITKALVLRPGTPDPVVRQLLASSPARKTATRPNISALPPLPPTPPCAAAYASARPEIVALNRVGKLNDSTVNRFAIRGETANLYTALSVLSGAPIEIVEHVMTDDDCEGLVMACRASRLNWQTTLAILSNRTGTRLSYAERERAQGIFESLLLSTSQWTVRWGEIAADARGSARAHRGGNRGG